jgi:lipid II:glycine glycyltransferase (peptidoglycan interpeptide bridge formation enzyme)
MGIYKLRAIAPSALSKWNQLIHSLPGGTIFHTPKWLKLIEDNQRLNIHKIGLYLNDNLIGVFPLCIKRFLFIKVAGSPFIIEDTPYMGPVIEPPHFSNFLFALDQYLTVNRIDFLRTISNQQYPIENISNRYHFITKHTHILNLIQTENALWKNLEGRCRTAIRRARKSGITITIPKSRNFVKEYYSLVQEVYYAQNKVCPNTMRFYYDMWDSFSKENVLFLSAEWDGKIIAGIIILIDGKSAYYLNGASSHKFRSLYPTNLLLWEAIKLAKEKGAEEFDFVGSDIPRLGKFKKSFGGQLVEYSLIEKASSPWIYRMRNRYPYYKQKAGQLIAFIGKMPTLRKFLP